MGMFHLRSNWTIAVWSAPSSFSSRYAPQLWLHVQHLIGPNPMHRKRARSRLTTSTRHTLFSMPLEHWNAEDCRKRRSVAFCREVPQPLTRVARVLGVARGTRRRVHYQAQGQASGVDIPEAPRLGLSRLLETTRFNDLIYCFFRGGVDRRTWFGDQDSISCHRYLQDWT